MNPGKLNSKVDVYSEVMVKSELGELQPTTKLIKRIWARVETRTGSLLMGRPADTMLSKTTHRIEIRKESIRHIDESCFFIWKDKVGKEHKFLIDYIVPPTKASSTFIYVREEI